LSAAVHWCPFGEPAQLRKKARTVEESSQSVAIRGNGWPK
jgi:hypothetical protein